MLYINEEKVLELLTWPKTFEAVELALKKVTTGEVFQPSRSATTVLNTNNKLFAMPGYVQDRNFGSLACKLVASFPSNNNLEKPLPTVSANIVIFDEITGLAKALIAGTGITTWRTAAASAVATKHIYVNKSKPCKILAVYGAGVQGKIHAEMFWYFFKFEQVRIWNRTADNAKKLVQKLNTKYNTNAFVFYENAEDCAREADVIVTATYAASPIIKLGWIKVGAHINAVGASQTHHSELEEKLYLNSDVYIDHWPGAKSELSGLEKLGVKFKGEVGSVITGSLSVNPNRITVFQALGMAAEDCTVARVVYHLYNKENK